MTVEIVVQQEQKQISSMRIKYFEPHITITIGYDSNTPHC